jgi:RNA polymerase sigma factor (sigma-70 family)
VESEHRSDQSAPPRLGAGTTMDLVLRAREGDRLARERLAARFLSPLKRFAHGRLPAGARGVLDTDDLVQETIVRALNHIDSFEAERPGAFLAYLRRILLNQVLDEARRAKRRPGGTELPQDLKADGPSPLEEAIGREALKRYETALHRLKPEHHEAVVMRIEFGCSYAEIAEAIGSPSENAARVAISRALARLAELMRDVREGA